MKYLGSLLILAASVAQAGYPCGYSYPQYYPQYYPTYYPQYIAVFAKVPVASVGEAQPAPAPAPVAAKAEEPPCMAIVRELKSEIAAMKAELKQPRTTAPAARQSQMANCASCHGSTYEKDSKDKDGHTYQFFSSSGQLLKDAPIKRMLYRARKGDMPPKGGLNDDQYNQFVDEISQ